MGCALEPRDDINQIEYQASSIRIPSTNGVREGLEREGAAVEWCPGSRMRSFGLANENVMLRS